jgi:ribose transport system substrate-binding protein
MRTGRVLRVAVWLCVVAGLGLTAGCAATATVPNRAGASNSADVGKAKAIVAAAEMVPKFIGPGSSVNGAALRGKTVWIVSAGQAVPFNVSIVNGVKAACAALGCKTVVFDGQESLPQWGRGVSEAVAAKASAIIMPSISPSLVTSEVEQAVTDNIPVVDLFSETQSAPVSAGAFAHVSISYVQSGRIQAAYVVAASKGNAGVIAIADNEFPSEVARVNGGIVPELHSLCSKCSVNVVEQAAGTMQSDLGSKISSALAAHPGADYIMAAYDAQVTYALPGIVQAGEAHTVKVVGADAVNLSQVRAKGEEVADVGEPLVWAGWGAVDEVLRALKGRPAADEHIPMRLFVATNIGSSLSESALFGGSYKSHYLKLWGVK